MMMMMMMMKLTKRPYLVSFPTYCQILVENREIYIPHLYSMLPYGVTPSEFRKGV